MRVPSPTLCADALSPHSVNFTDPKALRYDILRGEGRRGKTAAPVRKTQKKQELVTCFYQDPRETKHLQFTRVEVELLVISAVVISATCTTRSCEDD